MAEKTFAVIPPMMLFQASDESCIYANQHSKDRLGLDVASFGEKHLQERIHKEDKTRFEAFKRGEHKTITARLQDESGQWHPFTWKVRTLKNNDYFLAVDSVDVESEVLTPSMADGSFQPELRATLSTMAKIVEAKNPGMRCSILLLDEQKEYIALGAGPSLPDAYNKLVEGLDIGPKVGSCGTAAFWNIPVVVEDIFTDPLWENLLDAARIAGVSSCWSHPVTTTGGQVIGAMALYNNEPSKPERHHLDGLEIAARMVGLAVERDQLESQLSQAVKLEALGVLAGGIAHDFNNLLTAVMGNAELASISLDNKDKTSSMLSEIVTTCMKAREMCQQMLAYAGRSSFKRDHFDCNKEVEELGELMKVALSKKARLAFDLEVDKPGVLGDPSQLRQVIMNLITNASEALGNNDGEIRIRTCISNLQSKVMKSINPDGQLAAGDYVLIEVSDTGEGMDENTQNKIFDPFFTTKSSGRGLGLAAVQGIVQGHHGCISFDSIQGKGTVFSVYLPFHALPEDQEETEVDGLTVVDKTRILVVDDEEQVRKVFSMMLEKAGYDVIDAKDGMDALEICRKEIDSIDCVLLDFSMPKLNGLEVFQELQKLNKQLPVILTSGYTEKQLGHDLNGAGFASIIQKPVPMNILLNSVAEAMQNSTNN
jgi:signal transduction histidine kinase/ActR/RegA family two-component response regulator